MRCIIKILSAITKGYMLRLVQAMARINPPESRTLKQAPCQVFVRLESGEVGMELRNTLGGGKTKESGNAEGAGKRKCGRSGNAENAGKRKSGKCRKAEKRKMQESGKAENAGKRKSGM